MDATPITGCRGSMPSRIEGTHQRRAELGRAQLEPDAVEVRAQKIWRLRAAESWAR
jgi:hypothetical protein